MALGGRPSFRLGCGGNRCGAAAGSAAGSAVGSAAGSTVGSAKAVRDRSRMIFAMDLSMSIRAAVSEIDGSAFIASVSACMVSGRASGRSLSSVCSAVHPSSVFAS